MTMWRIKRMEPAPEATATVDCSPGQEARQATLHDTDTGTITLVQFCYDYSISVCENLNLIGESFTPNDWTTECEE